MIHTSAMTAGLIADGEHTRTIRETIQIISEDRTSLSKKAWMIAGAPGFDPAHRRRQVPFFTTAGISSIEKDKRMTDFSPQTPLAEVLAQTTLRHRTDGHLSPTRSAT